MFVEGVAPDANYRFKHALIQDAAYESLLKSRRQALHRRAAEALLASPAREAEALAHHFTQAGQTELAIEWWGKAGDQALRRSAFAEAISHLGKAIELSDKAGGARPRDSSVNGSAGQRLKLQTEYGQAVMWGKGFAADETKDAFARAAELATRIDGPEPPLDAYVARWVHSYFCGELGLALEAAESLLRGAERAARPTEAAAGHRLLARLRGLGHFLRTRVKEINALTEKVFTTGRCWAGQRGGGDFGRRLGRQVELHAVDEQAQFGLGLGVTGEDDLAPVGSGQMDVDHLHGGEFLQGAAGGEAGRETVRASA